jgi:hypothetical protein
VVVEDRNATGDTVKTSIMVDFEVVVCGDGKPPVAFVPPTPACGSTMVAAVGEELSFTVQLDAATDTVPGRALGVTGLPPGATLTPALPALGTTFRWTPTQAAKGSYTVTFSAYDVCAPKGGALTQCSYTIKVGNRPDCSRVRFTYKGQPGPPNGLLWPVNIEGVTDADGDPLTYTYSVTQDENPASGACPDAVVLGSGSSDLQVRSERDGNGDGRVYYVHYTATETGALGLSCSGVDSICIPNGGPHARCTDNGQNFSSFGPCLGQVQSEAGGITSAITRVGIKLVHATSTETAFEYALPADSDVQLGIYDIAGRLVETLENSRQTAGVHRVAWRTGGMAHGIYYYRLRAGAVLISKSLMILK